MRKLFLTTITFVLAAFSLPALAGLDSFMEGLSLQSGKMPEASAGFTPKGEYPTPKLEVIRAVLDAFDANQIAIAIIDKDFCKVNSDYVPGPKYSMLGGILGGNVTRYKFSLSCRESDGKTKLNVIAVVESSGTGGNGSEQWMNISSQNKEGLVSLQNWMYEQVEKQLAAK